MRIDAAIIGVHKCGTTALLEMLLQHPRVTSHATGQWPYFLHQDDYREVYPEILRTYFEGYTPDQRVIVRDTSLYLETTALRRLEQLSPGVKAIVIVKDPVARAYSAYCYALSRGFETDEDFSRIIAEQADGRFMADKPLICNYVRMGMYYRNLEALRTVIPAERLCVLLASDLKQNPVVTCNRVFRFVGLPEMPVVPVVANVTGKTRSGHVEVMLRRDLSIKRVIRALVPLRMRLRIRRSLLRLNRTQGRFPPMRDQDREALQRIFSAENEKLREAYGIDFRAQAKRSVA